MLCTKLDGYTNVYTKTARVKIAHQGLNSFFISYRSGLC